MTPEEKAIELIDKYLPICQWKIGLDQSYVFDNAKKCALICCNEVLGYMGADRGYEFWTSVKQEIEKL